VEQGRDRGPARARPTVDEGHGGASELELLKRARAALEAHPARALRLARQHARRFPEGDLVQERQVVVVEALVRLGRVEEARARARRFRQRYPDSIHNRGIDAALERAQDR
jgi:outer membrane protein assembly factor BamD (BamD/ComL family)